MLSEAGSAKANTANVKTVLRDRRGEKVCERDTKKMSESHYGNMLRFAFITSHFSLSRCMNVGPVLQQAFTCKERSVLRGSFTDTGVYGFGDQRVNPEGVLMQTRALV